MPKTDEKVYHIRMDHKMIDDIELWYKEFAILYGVKVTKGEFCRAMIRLGMKEIQKKFIENNKK